MTRAAIHLLKRIPAAARTVPHAVITCQVGTGFGSSDEIVGRYSIFGVRQTDLLDLASEIFVKAYAGLDFRTDLCVQTRNEIFLRNPDLYAFDGLIQVLHKFVDGGIG